MKPFETFNDTCQQKQKNDFNKKKKQISNLIKAYNMRCITVSTKHEHNYVSLRETQS